MITFIASFLCLLTGYFIYGSFVERVFGIEETRPTPCYTSADGVDFVPLPTWKVYLTQFLNIAGTGPIFGVIQGILFGPAAYIWIVIGCIFGGATHDYLAGMLSLRRNGASLPEIIGDELGHKARIIMRLLSLILMVIVGAVFVSTPVGLLHAMTNSWGIFGSIAFWTVVVFAYYFCATMLPITKLIARIYPIFGAALLVMAIGVLYGIFANGGSMPEVTEAFANHHPQSAIPLFPGLCITISCGAVSGFHATQSPMMTRCLKNEKYGRMVFYGAMITEGIISLIWAAATLNFVDSLNVAGETPYEKIYNVMTDCGSHSMNPAIIVNLICQTWLGKVGAVLAVLGVVAAPITTGDTAFRSARLIASDFMHYPQDKIRNRILVALPIFAVSMILMFSEFSMIWRYLGWLNQTLAVFTLWAITVWLLKNQRCYMITLIPAMFMTMVCTTYICIAPEGFTLDASVSYGIGAIVTGLCAMQFVRFRYNDPAKKKGKEK